MLKLSHHRSKAKELPYAPLAAPGIVRNKMSVIGTCCRTASVPRY
jgi:hypothetical protein